LVFAVIAAMREPSDAMIQRGAYAAIEQWGREPDARS